MDFVTPCTFLYTDHDQGQRERDLCEELRRGGGSSSGRRYDVVDVGDVGCCGGGGGREGRRRGQRASQGNWQVQALFVV